MLVQTESVLITPTAITVRGSTETSAEIQQLADSLARLDGWQLQQPQINASGQSVQATLQFKRGQEVRP